MPFESPGQAVAKTLQEVLASNRAEKRQAMLDALNQKNTESEIAYRNENAKSMAEERAALAKYRDAEAQAAGLKSITDNPPEIGDVLSPDQEKFVPSSLKQVTGGMTLPSRNLAAAVTAPSLGGGSGESAGMSQSMVPSEKSSIPAQTRWAGTATQKNDQRLEQALPTLSEKLGNPNLTNTERLAIIMHAFRKAPSPDAVLNSFKSTTHPLISMDRNGGFNYKGQPITEAPDGAIVREVPAPPAVPPQPNTDTWEATDANGNPAILERNPKTGQWNPAKIPAGYTVSGKAGAAPHAPKSGKFDDRAMAVYTAAAHASDADPTNEAKKSDKIRLQGALIETYPTPKYIKSAVSQILASPESYKHSVDDLLKNLSSNKPLTPAELDDIRSMLTTIMGKQ